MGLALGRGMDVKITEPDVNTLAIQGPKAEDLLASQFLAAMTYGILDFLSIIGLISKVLAN